MFSAMPQAQVSQKSPSAGDGRQKATSEKLELGALQKTWKIQAF